MKRDRVFINCPYDEKYKMFFRLLIFLVYYFGYEPCFASEKIINSRIDRIIELIKNTKYSIHDISRIETGKTKTPRFNMPFELGMDYLFTIQNDEKKKILILDKRQGMAKQTLSDLNELDIEAHEDKLELMVKCVITFFKEVDNSLSEKSFSAQRILEEYRVGFHTWLYLMSQEDMFDVDKMTSKEFKDYVIKYFE